VALACSPGLSEMSIDSWVAGDSYERYVGRWSRLVAGDFIAWLDLPPQLRWLDVGCGTGVLSAGVLALAQPASIIGIDPSATFLELARAQLPDDRVRFETGDAQALPLGDRTVDVVLSGLVLNFVPDPRRAIREMMRVVRPGGTVALYVWDYAGAMQLMRYFWDAAAALDPDARELDEGVRFPICQPAALAALLEDAGLASVPGCALDVPTRFSDFDDYWSPFLGGQGPAPGYCARLPEAQRAALRDHLRATLPVDAAGGIALIARAFAVRGTVPAT
jgi:SAM-dependent methyltransferase